MAKKTDTEVLIGGKVLTLSGYESEEYMQRVAAYINGKISEFSKVDGYKRQSLDTQNMLLELNIADDYFKAKEQADILRSEADRRDKELYDIKHDLITAELKLKSTEETLEQLQNSNTELQKRVVQLEAELKNSRNNDYSFEDEEAKEEAEVEPTEDDYLNIDDYEDEETERYAEPEDYERYGSDEENDFDDELIFSSGLYEHVNEDAEVVGSDEYEEKQKQIVNEDDFVQMVDGEAEFVGSVVHGQDSAAPQSQVHHKKKHYGRRR
ncbi:Cell division protein ZapA [Lachnospiraceae bacterium KH1T2]|nr:Cell division protein ZapA [Lachnospiraceae bacterium KH1T2]